MKLIQIAAIAFAFTSTSIIASNNFDVFAYDPDNDPDFLETENQTLATQPAKGDSYGGELQNSDKQLIEELDDSHQKD